MPAEWEEHEGTWLSWPHNPRTWVDNFGPIPAVFVKIVGALCEYENVHICVANAAAEAGVRKLLADASLDSAAIRVYHIPTNDAWARDHGPIFVTRKRPAEDLGQPQTLFGEEDLAAGLATQLGLPAVELATTEIPAAALKLVPADLCRKHVVIPIALFDNVLTLAIADPYDLECLDEIRQVAKCQVDLALASAQDINAAITRAHGRAPETEAGPDPELAHLAILDWKFNSWGGKYPPWDDDDAVPERIARILKLPCFHPRMVLEGGSIEVNGRGTLITTESVLLNPNRNPGMSRKQIEARLDEYLAARKVIWLGAGIAGDDTDGHIDDLARFVSATAVVAVVEEDARDENYRALQENFERLQNATDQAGRRLDIVKLPTPGKVFRTVPGDASSGERLPASYANFYIGNGSLLVPVFGHENDASALGLLGEHFPAHKVIGIDCKDLVGGYGAIHCVTQQQPR